MTEKNIQKSTEDKSGSGRRRFEGVVLNKSGAKTIRVLVNTLKMHPKYRKQYTVTKTYGVHDGSARAVSGDKVVFEECRPISKTKKWRLVNVAGKNA
ncbi:MAG: 30S ribosomal protein S17 [Candidatus Magasanikbacteria bacterium]|nr:30S ribosomal protein S17 [Candidatus Magasanikbacteria bacterium]